MGGWDTLKDIGKVVTGIGSVIPGPWQPFALAGSAVLGAVDANQARQNQKGQIGAQQKQSQDRYASLSPFRVNALNEAAHSASGEDFSSDYSDPTNPYAGGFGYKSVENRYAPLVDKLTHSVTDAPDRLALVEKAIADFDANEAGKLRNQYREIGQVNAKLGRLGSGMVDDSTALALGDSSIRRKTLSNDLIREAVSGTLQDRLNQLDAVRGVSGDDIALQERERGFNKALGSEAVGYKTARRKAEQDAKDAAYRRAMGYAGVGFDTGTDYGPMAGFYGDQAATHEAGVNDLLQYLPLLLNRGGGAGNVPTARGARVGKGTTVSDFGGLG